MDQLCDEIEDILGGIRIERVVYLREGRRYCRDGYSPINCKGITKEDFIHEDMKRLDYLLVLTDQRIIIELPDCTIHREHHLHDVVKEMIDNGYKTEKIIPRNGMFEVKDEDLCYSFGGLLIVGKRLSRYLHMQNIVR